jgi:hypothetical protein
MIGSRGPKGVADRALRRGRFLVPFVAFTLVIFPIVPVQTVVGGLFGLLFIALVARHPGPAVVALTPFVVFMPYLVLPLLYKWGVPAEFVRPMSAIKEGIGIGLLVAAFVARQRQRSAGTLARAGLAERLVVIYVVATVAYLLLPGVLSSAGAPTAWSPRFASWRTNVGMLLIFLGARYAPIDARWRRRAVRALLVTAVVVTLGAIWQWRAPDRFTEFINEDLEAREYNIDVIGTPPAEVYWTFTITENRPVRAGSILVSQFDYADLALLGACICVESLVRRTRAAPGLALALLTGGILASHTRANLTGLAFVGGLALLPTGGRSSPARLRMGIVLLFAAVLAVPSLADTRFAGEYGADESTDGHIEEFTGGVERLVRHPLGAGLGTVPNVGARYVENVDEDKVFISDNALIQVGNELGLAMMVLFAVMLFVLLRQLTRAGERDPTDPTAAIARLGIAALLVVGFFHQTFITLAVTWPLFALAGMALGARAGTDPSTPKTSVAHRPAAALAAR